MILISKYNKKFEVYNFAYNIFKFIIINLKISKITKSEYLE